MSEKRANINWIALKAYLLKREENEMLSDPFVKEAIEGLEEFDNVEKAEELIQAINQKIEVRTKKETKVFSLPIRIAAIAAGFALLFSLGAGLDLFKTQPMLSASLYDAYFEAYPNDTKLTLRTLDGNSEDVSTVEARFEKAMTAYDEKNFNRSIEYFQEVLILDKNNTTALFFMGIAFLQTNQIDSALKNFELVRKLDNSGYQRESMWYIALSNLKLKNTEQTVKALHKVIDERGFYVKEAKALLDKLED